MNDICLMKSSNTLSHILLVEDNPADARLIFEAVTSSGLERLLQIHHKIDGEQALSELTLSADSPKAVAFILLDLNLPKMKGMTLLEHIGNDVRLCAIPVIVMSNSDSPSEIAHCYALGAKGYIQKPADYSRLEDFFHSIGRSLELTGSINTSLMQGYYLPRTEVWQAV